MQIVIKTGKSAPIVKDFGFVKKDIHKLISCTNFDYKNYEENSGFCTFFNEEILYKRGIRNHCVRTCKGCLAKNASIDNYKEMKNFAVITSYFNPQKSANRYKNFQLFAQHMKDLGIPLYTIEGHYYLDDPQLTKQDCENLITVEYYDILWQKERLLNILVESLPPEIDCLGWFDADIFFSCDNLKEQCLEVLSYYPVIQPWSSCAFLDKEEIPSQYFYSMSSDNFFVPNKTVDQQRNHPGFAWCIRKETWEQIKGFYDVMICGNGDTFMAMGFFNHLNYPFLQQEKVNEPTSKNFIEWWDICSRVVGGNVSFLDLEIKHLYHGTRENRQYWERVKNLFDNGFSPNEHLELAENQTYKFTKNTPDSIRNYLSDLLLNQRRDDD